MLFDTNSRTAAANSRRSVAFKNLVAELKGSNGYDANEKKFRNHWDYMRRKAVTKEWRQGRLSPGRKAIAQKRRAQIVLLRTIF
ncbi:hypothetical protein ANCCAN_08933 [Ancylostoma caninum]|uniref:MADF domain-containing protein n=1 Tax=Ancylostoma caninum TaxID=29170 RepID=A0A368GN66_ANCCA|nr:hypothetical protein ANCCAN_08933 [Ancylostoma caninum]